MGEEAGSEEWVEEDQADVAVALLLLATHLVLPLLLIIILLILMHTCLDLVLGQILVLNKVLLSSLDLRMEVVDPCGEDVKTAVPPNMSPEEVRANSAADAAANMVSSIITNVANIAQDAVLNPNRSTTSRASVPAAAPFSTVPLSKEAPQAEFVEDVTFAQGATVPANSSFVKKWTIKNTGTTPWPVNSRLEVCGHDYIFSNASKDLGDLNLDPGCSTEISITLIAPECSG